MPEPAPIRTFHARRGRMGPRAADAVARLWPLWGVDVDGTALDLASLFGPGVPVVVDFGFGMGEATATMAMQSPEVGILAVEVHTPGIAALLQRCESLGITNVRVARGDGVQLLAQMLPRESLHGIRAYFPDPWPKARHHKRRFIRPDLVPLIADRLAVGGLLHTATDWPEYAERMLEVLTLEPLLRNCTDGYAERPVWRPVTGFERRAIEEGRTVRDLIFRRVRDE